VERAKERENLSKARSQRSRAVLVLRAALVLASGNELDVCNHMSVAKRET